MKARLTSAILIACIVILDRLTKLYIRAHYMPWDVTHVIPGFFDIVHAENPGAAFSMFSESNALWRSWLLIGISVVVMVVIAGMLWKPASLAGHSAAMRIGLAFVFGGAMGNLWDRLFRGTVTDFLDFYYGPYQFPAFNVADSAISVGAALLLIDLWFARKPASRI